MSEFKSSSKEEFICISYYDTEDLPIDRHCIKYRNIKYDIQEVLERTDDIDYVISGSKTTRNLLKENDKQQEEIERLNNKNEELLALYTTEREVKDYYKNIISELEKIINLDFNYVNDDLSDNFVFGIRNEAKSIYRELQELKGEIGDVR